jgi:hypothetical protein
MSTTETCNFPQSVCCRSLRVVAAVALVTVDDTLEVAAVLGKEVATVLGKEVATVVGTVEESSRRALQGDSRLQDTLRVANTLQHQAGSHPFQERNPSRRLPERSGKTVHGSREGSRQSHKLPLYSIPQAFDLEKPCRSCQSCNMHCIRDFPC